MADLNLGTLYDFNKEAMNSVPPLSPQIRHEKLRKVAVKMNKKGNYYMLLCHERRDYTIFKTVNGTPSGILVDLEETLVNRGNVVSIDLQDDGAWEIWIKDNVTSENFAYYLFDYTNAVVICE